MYTYAWNVYHRSLLLLLLYVNNCIPEKNPLLFFVAVFVLPYSLISYSFSTSKGCCLSRHIFTEVSNMISIMCRFVFNTNCLSHNSLNEGSICCISVSMRPIHFLNTLIFFETPICFVYLFFPRTLLLPVLMHVAQHVITCFAGNVLCDLFWNSVHW